MTIDDYNKELRELKLEFENKKRKLVIKYINENNKYPVGSIVTDHIGSVLVEKISAGIKFNGEPEVIYFGVELKKDKTPTKKGSKRQVWGSNLLP